jgi:hypothetical protein
MAAYEGEILAICKPSFDFTSSSLVVVSGDKFNPCGHALLNVGDTDGGVGGWYFQVAGVYSYPRYMDEAGYQRYLTENGKTELFRSPFTIPNPDGAIQTLEQVMMQKWVWGVLVHNCGTFVEAIVEGGGGTTNNPLNCPVLVQPILTPDFFIPAPATRYM